jgi:hypothetical protein
MVMSRVPRARIPALVISGSMGAGKTTVLGEISDLLTERGELHAAIELDWLDHARVPHGAGDDLLYRNLAAVWRNYTAAGIARAVLAGAIETPGERRRLHAAMPGAALAICRLRARLDTMRARVRLREPGLWQVRYVDRVAELDARLDAGGVADFCVDNDDRSITDVAREILRRAGWMPPVPARVDRRRPRRRRPRS